MHLTWTSSRGFCCQELDLWAQTQWPEASCKCTQTSRVREANAIQVYSTHPYQPTSAQNRLEMQVDLPHIWTRIMCGVFFCLFVYYLLTEFCSISLWLIHLDLQTFLTPEDASFLAIQRVNSILFIIFFDLYFETHIFSSRYFVVIQKSLWNRVTSNSQRQDNSCTELLWLESVSLSPFLLMLTLPCSSTSQSPALQIV